MVCNCFWKKTQENKEKSVVWIPVITILWALGDNATWVNFPMVNFPFSSSDKCYEYVGHARAKITQDPQYLNGYSTCVYIGSPTGENT